MENIFYDKIISNINKIMRDKNLTQAAIAGYIETSPSQLSKILTNKVKLSIHQLSKLATHLAMSEIDIITYPDKYVKVNSENDPVDAIMQIKLSKKKKDEVLKLVLGDNFEILK